MAALTVGYALSPIDVIPDFVPILGYLDDMIILPLLITLAVKFIPDIIMDECLEQAKGMWSDGKPWVVVFLCIALYIFIVSPNTRRFVNDILLLLLIFVKIDNDTQ